MSGLSGGPGWAAAGRSLGYRPTPDGWRAVAWRRAMVRVLWRFAWREEES